MKVARLAALRWKLLLSGPRNWLTLLLLPALLAVLLLVLLQATVRQAAVPVAVADLDQSEYSRKIIARLEAVDVLAVVHSAPGQVRQQVLSQRVDCAIVIPAGFADAIRRGNHAEIIEVYSGPTSLAAPFVKEIVASQVMRFASNQAAADWVVNSYARYHVQAEPDLWQRAWDYADAQWEPAPLFTISAAELPPWQGDRDDGGRWLSPVALLATAAGVMLHTLYSNQWFLEDGEKHLHKRLRHWGIKPLTYFLGNSLAAFAVSALQMCALLALMLCALPALRSDWLTVLAAFGLFVAANTFLGTLIACWSQTRKHALLLGSGIAVFTTALAGPLLTWPGQGLLPQYWLLQACTGLRAAGLEALGWIAAALFALSLLSVRWKYGHYR